jgi:NAD(P)-dependent dehydrogenase (short-subunit alcohol dehydrogenase family)
MRPEWDAWLAAPGFGAKYACLTGQSNTLGFPAMAAPCGFVDGMPVSLQVVARPDEDAKVLRVARGFQRAFPVTPRSPERTESCWRNTLDLHLNDRHAIVANADCEAAGAVARALAREGARLSLQGGSGPALRSLAQELAGVGGREAAIFADMTSGEAVRAAARATPVDIAIFVLPPLQEGRLTEMGGDVELVTAWKQVEIVSDLFQTALSGMKARSFGRLLFVGPVEAKAQTARQADLDRTVALGILGMLKALSGEAGSYGITCNSVLWDSAPEGEARTRILDGLAGAVAYLASPLAGFLTGTTVAVDEARYGGTF